MNCNGGLNRKTSDSRKILSLRGRETEQASRISRASLAVHNYTPEDKKISDLFSYHILKIKAESNDIGGDTMPAVCVRRQPRKIVNLIWNKCAACF